jgi:hypothetical protein
MNPNHSSVLRVMFQVTDAGRRRIVKGRRTESSEPEFACWMVAWNAYQRSPAPITTETVVNAARDIFDMPDQTQRTLDAAAYILASPERVIQQAIRQGWVGRV